jgi:CRP-like cAMP-binding protein
MTSPVRLLRRPGVQVFAEDPDLIAQLHPSEARQAVEAVMAPQIELSPGPWPPHEPRARAGTIGLLVLDGLVGVEVANRERASLELLGPGDVVRPWDETRTAPGVYATTGWTVLAPLRAALLDRHVARAIAPWPEVTAALLGRTVARCRRLSLQMAINGLALTEDRLLLTLWQLADRFGRVTPDHVTLPLPLTHAQLGKLISVRRQSVTTALGRLSEAGLVEQDRLRGIRLVSPPPRGLRAISGEGALAGSGPRA